MVTRVNGYVQQGIWVERDVKIVNVTATGATFLADLVTKTEGSPDAGELAVAVNSDLEQVAELVAQRGTLLGIHVGGANSTTTTAVSFMVGYANANETDDTDLEAQIDAIAGLSDADVQVLDSFFGVVPGTPA